MQQGVSVVVPFLNEEDNVIRFCEELDQFRNQNDFPIELIFVDDGSTDQSVQLLSNFRFRCIDRYCIISLSKNFGSHAAIRAGIEYASYDICTWMAVDLQEPIEFIQIGYEKITGGLDAVFFEKESVKISPVERAFSKVYSRLMIKYAVPNYGKGGIANIMFNGKIKKYLRENVEINSAINLQIMNAGFKNTTISMKYQNRVSGKSKWTLSKKIKLFIDSFVAFSFMPIRLVSIIGIMMFLLGIIYGIIIIVSRLLHPLDAVAGYATLASLLAIGFGITNISLGIIAEYLWRTYDAASRRPAFIIADIKEFKTNEKAGIDDT
jgi:glycosyltransferase involved in cell wall biosynthesis|nr:glycosyltransferase [uncultured Acetatifactor sp.]